MSRIWLLDCFKLVIKWKNDNGIPIFQHDIIANLFNVVSCYLSKYHVKSLLVLKLWHFIFTRDGPEILKSEISPLSLVQYLKTGSGEQYQIGTNNSNEILLHAAKCQCCNLFCFWVIKRKPNGAGIKSISPPPQISIINTTDGISEE